VSNKFSFWIPFIIFFLGYFLTWRKNQLDKKKEIKIYRDLIIEWITLAKVRTTTQIANCRAFSKSILESEHIDAAPYKHAPLMYEKLNAINIDKTINVFVFNSSGLQTDKLQNFNKLTANINFLDKVEEELKQKYEKSSVQFLAVNEEFNKTFISIESIFLRRVNETGVVRGNKDFKHIQTLNDLRVVYDKTSGDAKDGITAIHTFDKLVTPWLEYVQAAFNHDKSNAFLFELYNELTNMQLIKRRWKAYKDGYSQIFINYADQMEISYSDLEDCVAYFNKSKIASWWKVK
jgi:hypothetical protein